MKTLGVVLLVLLVFALALATGALAQEGGLTLKLSRDWGYGGLGGDIQGTFSMRVTGAADLARVEFYIDDARIGEVTAAPFNLQFVTDNFPEGVHTMRAVGFTSGGQELRSQPIGATFVSKSASNQALVRIIVPLLAVVGGAMLLTFVFTLVTGRKAKRLPPGTPRQYPMGGGICPRCSRPVALQILGLNMLVGKFQRCPYCGKWSVFRRVPLGELRAAEQAEVQSAAGHVPAPSEEERLKKELDDSKYQGL